MNPLLASRFQLLRVRIESDIKAPSVIMVTSGLAGDGKSLTSYGLADSLAKAGHRVVVVDTAIRPRHAQNVPTVLDKPQRFALAGLPDDDNGPQSSRESIFSFVQQVRSSHDYAIIDAAPLLDNSTAMLISGAVDAVILAIRHGRSPSEADELMIQTLKHAKAKVFGVVASSAEHILDFNRSRSIVNDDAKHIIPLEPNVDDMPSAALFAQ